MKTNSKHSVFADHVGAKINTYELTADNHSPRDPGVRVEGKSGLAEKQQLG